ncbi:uncharacterized protein LY79DRAFT_615863 [Colletotrichum navitas]|uniref:Phosphotransferase enzyme family protein n=1 Tax=Colletotrichum navitas TaxID=681940 RepID=A0AAD8UZQ0_9PEZI|nr:uncharacterized protein LY79DRAFT_615863 [Colletotrichum navitas]KAK1573882.1 hypothetical protein LY79DRAFT_615863 [Colletotrichum navitas]
MQERCCDLDKDERRVICEELKEMLQTLRALEKDSHDWFVGRQPLNNIFLPPKLRGPFVGSNAVKQFQDACGIDIDGEALAPNITLSLGKNPKVAAIIDWRQAGWLPEYWEYCKARRVNLNPKLFSHAAQEEWRTDYLPTILDPVDEEACHHPWLHCALANI